jgi:MFS family permease
VIELLRQRVGFRRLFVADAVSMVGDWLTYVAVGLLALEGPSGLFGVAIVQLAHTLPQTVAAPAAGWLSDRMDRRTLLVITSLVRGAITLAMAFAAARGEIALVLGLLFARMAGASFVAAPSRAALPRLVEPSELGLANRLIGSSWAAIFTFGVALGGVVAGFGGPTTALALDAATFLVAAVLFLRLEPLPPQVEEHGSRGSLFADARANPERVRAALAKVPSQVANGGIWIVLHALVAGAGGAAAFGLGALHATRGVGNGVGAWILRRLGARRMVALGVVLTVAGGLLVALDRPIAMVLGSLSWGVGVGTAWVGGMIVLQRAVPDAVLGRYAALDVGATSIATGLGGLGAAWILSVASPLVTVAIVGGVALALGFVLRPPARPPTAAVAVALAAISLATIATPAIASSQYTLRAALAARAVTDDDFARTELFSWTTVEQGERLRADHRLLVAAAADGAVRSPYQLALDRVAAGDGADASLARLLSEHPGLARRRYGWTTPYGTVVPRGSRPYGPVLVRMRLSDDAWTVRFAPDEVAPFRVVDGRGTNVPLEVAIEHPTRLGAVYHVRARARLGPYREHIVHGAAQLVTWTVGEALRARVDDDRRVLSRLARAMGGARPRALFGLWATRPAADAPLTALFAATMPFDDARHRPSRDTLRALERALARQRPRGETLTVDARATPTRAEPGE